MSRATAHRKPASAQATRLSRGALLTDLPGLATSLSASADFTPPEWVHLIPAGTFYGRDGRGPYTLDAQAVLDAFAAGGIDLPLDYEHQTLSAEDKTGPVPAAGWIKALQARADGIWAQVEWTAQATALLADKAYRFLSPVFRFIPADGRVVALAGAGLVHTPNLTLQAAARSEAHSGTAMDELLERLPYILNLPVTTTPEEMLAELQKVMDAVKAQTAAAEAMRAEIEQLKTALSAQSQSTQPDPAQWVPLAQHKAVAEQLAALQSAQAEAAAQAAVDAAQSAGKVAPALRDWALGYARADLAGFEAFAAASPALAGDLATQGRKPAADAALTDEDRIACKLLGLTEAQFAAHKAAQPQHTQQAA
ncbi:MAG: phage protease [Pseudomonadota bacterium]